MRLQDAERLISQYPDATVSEIADRFKAAAAREQQRSRALFQADLELEVDQILCEVMFVLQKVHGLTSLTKTAAIKRRSEDSAKAMVIAKHALEIAAEGLIKEYRPMSVKRV